jgi:hypothetical protein
MRLQPHHATPAFSGVQIPPRAITSAKRPSHNQKGDSGSATIIQSSYRAGFLLVTRHSSLLLNNYLYFHQHNGKTTVTAFLFINIMERPISDIFPPFVFNDIMEDTFIFSPRVFSLPRHQL